MGETDRFDSLRLIPWWDQQKLAAAKILVVGAGALGNEAIKNLTLMGVGNIAIVDMDTIESSNLSRSVLYRQSDAGSKKAEVAARRAREIDPNVNAIALPHNVIHEVGWGWFADADCVLGCLDNREARLWVNRCCWHVGTPWIDAGIQEISGVVQVFKPPHGTCYECGMKEADYRLINLRYSCPLLREEDLKKGRVPTTPTISSIIAGWQVQEALKLMHGLPTAESTAMVFHGMTNHVYQTKLPRRDDCLSHDPWESIFEVPGISADSTLLQLLDAAAAAWEMPVTGVTLARDLLTRLHCAQCDQGTDLCQLRASTAAATAICPTCGHTMSPDITTRISREDDALVTRTLADLAIPTCDIVQIETSEGVRPCRIAGPTYCRDGDDRGTIH
jgi:adenylyltransferase/sulfurtransferase